MAKKKDEPGPDGAALHDALLSDLTVILEERDPSGCLAMLRSRIQAEPWIAAEVPAAEAFESVKTRVMPVAPSALTIEPEMSGQVGKGQENPPSETAGPAALAGATSTGE